MEQAPQVQRIGRYDVVRKIATGGMAELFLARYLGPGGFEKRCALKRILPQFAADETFTQMFLTEAKVTAQLDHPNIVQIFELGQDDNGQYFIAMELVNGLNLRQLLTMAKQRRQMVPPELAGYVALQALEGLAYAHELKSSTTGEPLSLVHRDVSPQNILVSYDGAVKLVDFGIVKGSTISTETVTGMLKGKVAYMSPEQAMGETLDGRSDLFSLAVVLYEQIAGERPFTGANDLMVLKAILESPPRPLTHFAPECPDGIERAIIRGLAKYPQDRFPSARGFHRELDLILRACPIPLGRHVLAEYLQSLTEGSTVSFDATRLKIPRRFSPVGFAHQLAPASPIPSSAAAGAEHRVPLPRAASASDPLAATSGAPSLGASPLSEGARPPPDGARPPPDGASPPPDGARPPPEGARPPPDGASPPPDGASSPLDEWTGAADDWSDAAANLDAAAQTIVDDPLGRTEPQSGWMDASVDPTDPVTLSTAPDSPRTVDIVLPPDSDQSAGSEAESPPVVLGPAYPAPSPSATRANDFEGDLGPDWSSSIELSTAVSQVDPLDDRAAAAPPVAPIPSSADTTRSSGPASDLAIEELRAAGVARPTGLRSWAWLSALTSLALIVMAWAWVRPDVDAVIVSPAEPPPLVDPVDDEAIPLIGQSAPPDERAAPILAIPASETAPDAGGISAQASPSEASEGSRPAAARPAPKGRLVLETEPTGLLVKVKGRRLGTTPLKASLPPGQHLLRVLSRRRGIARSLAITVEADQTTTRRLVLRPGKLHVVSRPWSEAFLNERPLGKTPLKVTAYEGRYRLKLVSEDGAERLQTVRVKPSETTLVRVIF